MFSELMLYSLIATIFYYSFGEYKQNSCFKDQIKQSYWAIIVSSPISALLQYLLYNEYYGYMYYQWDEYGILYLSLSGLLFVFLMDTAIYWLHRLLHLPYLYKKIHYIHHQYHPITSYAASALDPVDLIVTVIIAGTLPLLILPLYVDLHMILIWITFTWGIYVHNSRAKGVSFLYDAVDHRVHHTTGRYNYALFTRFWDTVCATYVKYK